MFLSKNQDNDNNLSQTAECECEQKGKMETRGKNLMLKKRHIYVDKRDQMNSTN